MSENNVIDFYKKIPSYKRSEILNRRIENDLGELEQKTDKLSGSTKKLLKDCKELLMDTKEITEKYTR